MGKPDWESELDALRLDLNRRLKLQFRGAAATSDLGPYPVKIHRRFPDSMLAEMMGETKCTT